MQVKLIIQCWRRIRQQSAMQLVLTNQNDLFNVCLPVINVATRMGVGSRLQWRGGRTLTISVSKQHPVCRLYSDHHGPFTLISPVLHLPPICNGSDGFTVKKIPTPNTPGDRLPTCPLVTFAATTCTISMTLWALPTTAVP